MPNQIKNPPASTPDFGLEFDYNVWPKDTVVSLCNVKWDSAYVNIVPFGNESMSIAARRALLNAYIDNLETPSSRIEKMSYHKPNTPVKINMPYNKALKYNYLRASNPLQPIPGNDVRRDYYYFILDVRYSAPNTTELVLQLDVMQTYGYDVEFGVCFIDRGHVGIANTKNFDGYGRDYLSIPEGLEVGGEYRVVHKRSQAIMRTMNSFEHNILVVSTVDLESDDFGNEVNPIADTAPGSSFEGIVSGASYYVFKTVTSFKAWADSMKNKPWITRNIVHISVIPPLQRYHPEFEFNSDSPPLYSLTEASDYSPLPQIRKMYPGWRNADVMREKILPRYRHLLKFFTFPYMAIEITTWTGTPILVKPEAWNNPDAELLERSSMTVPGQRVEFVPRRYNADDGSPIDWIMPELQLPPDHPLYPEVAALLLKGDDWGDYIDFSTKITNFPTLAILNDGGIAYLASNAHAIQQAYKGASWAQERALAGNRTSYDNTSAGMELSSQLTKLGIGTDRAQTELGNQTLRDMSGVNAAAGIIGGTASGLVGGLKGAAVGAASGVGSAVVSAAQVDIQSGANIRGQAIRASQANQANAAQNATAATVRDANKGLGDWAAKGDFHNQIAGIYAGIQDAAIIQPTTSGQAGGEVMNLVNNNVEVSVRWKMLDEANMKKIGEYWLRYGYSVLQFAPVPKLKVMSKFTYWKMTECFIVSSEIPEGFKNVIRGIFQKGTTAWENPDDIGVIDFANNTPIAGVTLP